MKDNIQYLVKENQFWELRVVGKTLVKRWGHLVDGEKGAHAIDCASKREALKEAEGYVRLCLRDGYRRAEPNGEVVNAQSVPRSFSPTVVVQECLIDLVKEEKASGRRYGSIEDPELETLCDDWWELYISGTLSDRMSEQQRSSLRTSYEELFLTLASYELLF